MSTSTVDVARIKQLLDRVDALEKAVAALQAAPAPVQKTLGLPQGMRRTEREGARN